MRKGYICEDSIKEIKLYINNEDLLNFGGILRCFGWMNCCKIVIFLDNFLLCFFFLEIGVNVWLNNFVIRYFFRFCD